MNRFALWGCAVGLALACSKEAPPAAPASKPAVPAPPPPAEAARAPESPPAAEPPVAKPPPAPELAPPETAAPKPAVAPDAAAAPPAEPPDAAFKRSVAALDALAADADLAAACAAVSAVVSTVPADASAAAVQRCADFAASKAPTCEALIDKAERCSPPEGDAPPRDSLVTACKEAVAAEPAQLTSMGECLNQRCDTYADCIDAARQGARQGKRIDTIRAASESGQFRKVSFLCAEQATAGGDAAVLAACRELANKAVATWKPTLEARRTQGGDPDLLCFDYQRLAGVISAEEQRAARDLCAELTLGRAVRDAVAATANTKNDLPYECDSVTSQLERNGSDWAKAAAQRVAVECYVTAGQRFLRAPGCPASKRAALEGIRRHGLTPEGLGPVIDAAKAACGLP